MIVPAFCRAAALVAPGRLEVIDVKIPSVLEAGAILVRTSAATVCATDVHVRAGELGANDVGATFPVILGHEMTGTVVRLGDGVAADSVGNPLAHGDRIVWTHGFCGQCVNCVVEQEPTLCTHRRSYMATPSTEYPYLTGGFAEYGYVFPTSGRVIVPASLSDGAAAAASCALRTVIHGFDRLGYLDDQHTVVVQGAGPLGLFALAKAVASGARQVIVIGGPKRRLELATAWGATAVIDIAEADPDQRREEVYRLTAGRGADIVVEMSGVPSAFGEGMGMLRANGRYLIVGQLHGRTVDFNPSSVVFKQATIIGCFSGSISHYWRALQFMEHHADRFRWDDMISGRYGLHTINDAFDSMSSWREIKPMVVFE